MVFLSAPARHMPRPFTLVPHFPARIHYFFVPSPPVPHPRAVWGLAAGLRPSVRRPEKIQPARFGPPPYLTEPFRTPDVL